MNKSIKFKFYFKKNKTVFHEKGISFFMPGY